MGAAFEKEIENCPTVEVSSRFSEGGPVGSLGGTPTSDAEIKMSIIINPDVHYCIAIQCHTLRS